MTPYQWGELFGTVLGKSITVALNTTIAALCAFLLWIAVNVFVPMAEKAIYPPVVSFDMVPLTCQGDHLIVRARLNKQEYWGGTDADYKGLTLRLVSLDRKDILWNEWFSEEELRAAQRNRNKKSRPAGLSTFDLILLDTCGKAFTAHTEHVSPITRLRIKMRWGPFFGLPLNKQFCQSDEVCSFEGAIDSGSLGGGALDER